MIKVVVSKYFNSHKNLDYRFQARWYGPRLRSLRKILDVLFVLKPEGSRKIVVIFIYFYMWCAIFCTLYAINNPVRYPELYRGADKSLARPTSRCILYDGKNIWFDASLVIFINSTSIPPIMIMNRMYEDQNLLSL